MLRSYGDVLKALGVKKSASVSFDAAVANEQMRTPKGQRHVRLVSGAAPDLPLFPKMPGFLWC
jgi:hypothetical protein